MKILSMQNYNFTPKVDPQLNTKNKNNVTFTGVTSEMDKLASKIGNDYQFIRLSVLKRFMGKSDLTTTCELSDFERENFQEFYSHTQEMLKSAVPSANGTLVKKINAGMYREYILESGPVSNVEGARLLLKHVNDSSAIKNCISYTIFSRDTEISDNYYRIIFDKNGFPNIVAYLNKRGGIIHAVIPEKSGI